MVFQIALEIQKSSEWLLVLAEDKLKTDIFWRSEKNSAAATSAIHT